MNYFQKILYLSVSFILLFSYHLLFFNTRPSYLKLDFYLLKLKACCSTNSCSESVDLPLFSADLCHNWLSWSFSTNENFLKLNIYLYFFLYMLTSKSSTRFKVFIGWVSLVNRVGSSLNITRTPYTDNQHMHTLLWKFQLSYLLDLGTMSQKIQDWDVLT